MQKKEEKSVFLDRYAVDRYAVDRCAVGRYAVENRD
jgi:hypothetical protein